MPKSILTPSDLRCLAGVQKGKLRLWKRKDHVMLGHIKLYKDFGILAYFKTNGKLLKCFKLDCGEKVGEMTGLLRKTHYSFRVKNELEKWT